jgi:hypothetical protein
VEGVAEPDAETRVVLREDLHYVIVRDKLLLVELCEDSFSKGLLYSFEVYFREACEDAVFPVSVSKESMKMRVVV